MKSEKELGSAPVPASKFEPLMIEPWQIRHFYDWNIIMLIGFMIALYGISIGGTNSDGIKKLEDRYEILMSEIKDLKKNRPMYFSTQQFATPTYTIELSPKLK